MNGLFNIPSHEPFAQCLVRGLLGLGCEEMASMLLFTPNRRAMRALEEAFMQETEAKGALILPTMMPLGEDDEDELLFAPSSYESSQELPPLETPSLEEGRLLLLLYEHILAYSASKNKGWSKARAMPLAHELLKFLSDLHTERVSLDEIDALNIEEHGDYWQIILDFLTILKKDLPALLHKLKRRNPLEAQDDILMARMDLWRHHPPAHGVMVVGSTGSRPLTRQFMKEVLRLDKGALVLPGLNQDMDDAAWQSIKEHEPTHPHYGMARLLDDLQCTREEVKTWPISLADEKTKTRAQCIQRAFVSSVADDKIPSAEITEPFLTSIEASHVHQEAQIITRLILARLHKKQDKIAFVTQNAQLNRVVAHELQKRDIVPSNSFGRAVTLSAEGIFMRLILEAARGQDSLSLLSLMKHPLFTFGGERLAVLAAARLAEDECLRQLTEKENDFLRQVKDILTPLHELMKRGASIKALVGQHLALTYQCAGGEEIFSKRPAGRILVGIMEHLSRYADDCGSEKLTRGEYQAFFDSYAGRFQLRENRPAHQRVFLWGALEARLQYADLLVIGGLNENSYPPAPHISPWLSGKWQKAMGLPPADWRIGLSAHDFVQSFACKEVILTHSLYDDQMRIEPSRFLTRLRYALPPNAIRELKGDALILPQEEKEEVKEIPPFAMPLVARRPKSLSVSALKMLMDDPYAFYARYILHLRKRKSLLMEQTPLQWGIRAHELLAHIVKSHPQGTLTMDACLADVAQDDILLELKTHDMMRCFIEWENSARILERDWRNYRIEQKGAMQLGDYFLSATADRIDVSGTVARIIEYKTGSAPSKKDIELARDPQLMVEALILLDGGYGEHQVQGVNLHCLKLNARGEDGRTQINDIQVMVGESKAQELRHQLRKFLAHFLGDEKTILHASGDNFDYGYFMRKQEWKRG